jgi:hypothetical protein
MSNFPVYGRELRADHVFLEGVGNAPQYRRDMHTDQVFMQSSIQYGPERAEQIFMGNTPKPNIPQYHREVVADQPFMGSVPNTQYAPTQFYRGNMPEEPPSQNVSRSSCFDKLPWTPQKHMRQSKAHWTAIHHEQGDKEFKETFAQDRTALVVAGALLMTVDFTALTLSPSSYAAWNESNEEVSYLYLVAFGVACSCSLGLILNGSFQYMTIHKFGSRQSLDVALYLEEITPVLVSPIALMVISWKLLQQKCLASA